MLLNKVFTSQIESVFGLTSNVVHWFFISSNFYSFHNFFFVWLFAIATMKMVELIALSLRDRNRKVKTDKEKTKVEVVDEEKKEKKVKPHLIFKTFFRFIPHLTVSHFRKTKNHINNSIIKWKLDSIQSLMPIHRSSAWCMIC